MVRFRLQTKNEKTDYDSVPLDFSKIAHLTEPFRDKVSVSILNFTIPNGAMPIIHWGVNGSNDYKYYFTLGYGVHNVTEFITYVDIGGANNVFEQGDQLIYDISNLLLMFNRCLTLLVSKLLLLTALPTSIAPRVIFDNLSGLFSIVCPKIGYDSDILDPIRLGFNTPTLNYFRSLPMKRDYTTQLYEFLFANNAENTYLVDYLKISQESISFPNFVSLRSIIVTTNMSIESEVVSRLDGSSGQSTSSILGSFDINYVNGLKDFIGDIRYTTVTEPYRRVNLNKTDIYDVNCIFHALLNDGRQLLYRIPSRGFATMELEFL